MKKPLLLAALLIAAFCTQAQDKGASNAVKINPLSLIFATGNVAYERATAPNQSFQLGVFYSGLSIGGVKYTGFGVTPEYRFYIGGQKVAMNGVYVAPFARYQNYTLKDDQGDKATLSTFGGGATIGWEKAWSSGFVLDLFAGPSYNSGTVKDSDGGDATFSVNAGISGFTVRTGITIGFAF